MGVTSTDPEEAPNPKITLKKTTQDVDLSRSSNSTGEKMCKLVLPVLIVMSLVTIFGIFGWRSIRVSHSRRLTEFRQKLGWMKHELRSLKQDTSRRRLQHHVPHTADGGQAYVEHKLKVDITRHPIMEQLKEQAHQARDVHAKAIDAIDQKIQSGDNVVYLPDLHAKRNALIRAQHNIMLQLDNTMRAFKRAHEICEQKKSGIQGKKRVPGGVSKYFMENHDYYSNGGWLYSHSDEPHHLAPKSGPEGTKLYYSPGGGGDDQVDQKGTHYLKSGQRAAKQGSDRNASWQCTDPYQQAAELRRQADECERDDSNCPLSPYELRKRADDLIKDALRQKAIQLEEAGKYNEAKDVWARLKNQDLQLKADDLNRRADKAEKNGNPQEASDLRNRAKQLLDESSTSGAINYRGVRTKPDDGAFVQDKDGNWYRLSNTWYRCFKRWN